MEVQEIDSKVLIVAAFLMYSGLEFQTESTITFCLALAEWNFEEVGVSTGAKRSRRGGQM